MQSTGKTVLFVAEAVTLAHYGRIATLSRSLAPDNYHVMVASDPRYKALDKIAEAEFHPIWSIPSSQFARALEQGSPLYDAKTLARYVENDLALIDTVKPDLIVGDFRLSLAVSAPLRRIPYASVVNAYWSPYADTAYPIPDLPFTRYTGLSVGQRLFDFVRPFAFALHARSLNQVRRHYGLPSLGSDLRNIYTWGDYTLYADIEELVPSRQLPDNHRYLGPILWSTRAPLPPWWDALPADRPLVFVILGSSGRADLLPMVLEALAGLPVIVIVATAGKVALETLPPNVFVADYLPMDLASERSTLVISNGGSLTTYQALAHGVPIIGICSNMDQLLNMGLLERLGAGIRLRATRISAAGLASAVTSILNGPSFMQEARRVAQILANVDVTQRFREFVQEVLC